MKNKKIIAVIIIIVTFAISVYYYPLMPNSMATHWGTSGQPDGFMSRFWGTYLIPLLSAFLFFLFQIFPKIDPTKRDTTKFFDFFAIIMTLFLLFVNILIIAWNLGYRFDMGKLILSAIGILFFIMGFIVENVKKNWFIGIRTPWTLSSDKVWKRTHKLGGKVFRLSGLLIIGGSIFTSISLVYLLFGALIPIFYLFFYSYLEYKKIGDKK